MGNQLPASTKDLQAPLLLYDGDCAFCSAWVEYWKQLTGERICYEPLQQASARFPEIPLEVLKSAVRLLMPDGEMRSGAQAVFTTLATVPGKKWLLWAYDHVPGLPILTESAYSSVAHHRSFAYKVTKVLWGIPIQRQTQALIAELFLRALGLIYLLAFVSFGAQAAGLIGKRGIVPVSQTLAAWREYYGPAGYRLLPSIFWLDSSDRFIAAVWIGGAVFAVLLALGAGKRLACVGLFVLYLSLVTAGQVFMSFQWDALLLEAGFLAIFLGCSGAIPWLFRWLLFRLIVMSGVVKLISGDQTWRHLTALQFHYETQPIPTPIAWYMHQLPPWFQMASTAAALTTELAAPFLIFFPRRLRFAAAAAIVVLQSIIFLTGNYAFFNLLTIGLCLFLIDDARVAGVLPARWVEKIRNRKPRSVGRLRRVFGGTAAAAILFLSFVEMADRFLWSMPAPAEKAIAVAAPFEIVNTYGLFAVMTTSRPEIVIEGSDDGVIWREYEFKYKPGDVRRRPPWIQPHQPRLDWQMWFAALGSYQSDPWIVNLAFRLLQGSPEVLGLLDKNPFVSTRPRYVRALVYDYRFTTFRERHATAAWWHRELKGIYFPPLTLDDFKNALP